MHRLQGPKGKSHYMGIGMPSLEKGAREGQAGVQALAKAILGKKASLGASLGARLRASPRTQVGQLDRYYIPYLLR